MVDLEKFLPYVMVEVPGASEPMAKDAILDSCIDFCSRSRALTELTDDEPLSAGVDEYEIAVSSGNEPESVLHAWLCGSRAHISMLRDQRQRPPRSGAGQPNSLMHLGGSRVLVDPTPDKDYSPGLSVLVAIRPKTGSKSVHDDLFNLYRDTVVAGALARLLSMNTRAPFANPALANFKRMEFISGVNRAMLASSVGGMTPRDFQFRIPRI